MKFSMKDFIGKCDQILRKLRIWSHLLKKSFMENFIFCVVYDENYLSGYHQNDDLEISLLVLSKFKRIN